MQIQSKASTVWDHSVKGMAITTRGPVHLLYPEPITEEARLLKKAERGQNRYFASITSSFHQQAHIKCMVRTRNVAMFKDTE